MHASAASIPLCDATHQGLHDGCWETWCPCLVVWQVGYGRAPKTAHLSVLHQIVQESSRCWCQSWGSLESCCMQLETKWPLLATITVAHATVAVTRVAATTVQPAVC